MYTYSFMMFLNRFFFAALFSLVSTMVLAQGSLQAPEEYRLRTQAKQNLVKNYLNSINPSLKMLDQMSNKHQLEAFNTLMNYTNILEVKEKLSGVLELGNEHQVRALKAIVSSQNIIDYDIQDLKKITNKFQSEVIEILTHHQNIDLKKNLWSILQFNNKHSVKALRTAISASYEVTYSLYDLSQIDERKQTDLIEKRVAGRFSIDRLFPSILFTCKKLF